MRPRDVPWREVAWRAAPYGLLVALAIAVTWPLLRVAGMPYNVDISGYFPLTPDAYQARFWPLWNERGGMSTLQFLPALLWESPLLALGHALGWDMAFHVKLRIVLGLALAGIGMYALVAHYARKHAAPRLPRWALATLPLVPAVFYMLNPWSIHRIFQYFLWMGYVLAPLVVLAFERFAEAPSARRACVFALVCAVASTDPHNPVTFALVLAPLGLARLLQASRRSRADAKRLALHVGTAAGTYALLTAFWLLPTAYNALWNPAFGPPYVMSDQMLQVLSRHATLLDVLRLTHNYEPRAALAPSGALSGAWAVASLVIPLLALHAAILRPRLATTWAYAALAVGTILLGFGSNAPTGAGYHWLLFGAPWGEGLSWLFRDPYRWGGIEALAYAVLAGLALHELACLAAGLRRPALRNVARLAAPAFALACVALFVAPAAGGYMAGPFAPVRVPSEYAQANAYLAATPGGGNVLWMPRMLGPTTWAGSRTLEYFDATSSARPAFGPFRAGTSGYFDFLDDAIKDGAPVAPLLSRIGVADVMYHNDLAPGAGATALQRLEAAGFQERARFGESRTGVIDQSALALTYTPAARYPLYGARQLEQLVVPSANEAGRLFVTAARVGHPGAMALTWLDAENRTLGSWRGVEPSPTSVSFDLGGLALVPGATYAFRLAVDGAAGDASNRYDVSYYTVDTYDAGAGRSSADGQTWSDLGGDAAFELHAIEHGFLTALANPQSAARLRAGAPAASPDDLTVLRNLAGLPASVPLRDAPVVFTNAGASASDAFVRGNGSWAWVTDFGATRLDAVAPFLPAASIVAPFRATTSADGKLGWARGAQGFAYEGLGWDLSLAARKQEDWGFDGGKGIVFTGAAANLTVPLPSQTPHQGIVLARVYGNPRGGQLHVWAGGSLLGSLETRSDLAGWRWIAVGEVDHASSLRLESVSGFQGVNLLAVVPKQDLADAEAASAARFAHAPTTLLAQAEAMPALTSSIVSFPGVGRFASLPPEAALTFESPSGGNASLWLRVANASRVPNATLDGAPAGQPRCVASCDAPGAWVVLPLGPTTPGTHALGLRAANETLVDELAVTTADLEAPASDATLSWTREQATVYDVQVHARQPAVIAFAQPFDAGWIARDQDGRVAPSVVVDGVVNGFLVDAGTTRLHIEYAPQTWAERGALVTAATLGALLLLLAPIAWRAVPRPRGPRAASEEVS